MAKRKRTKGQTMIYKTQHRKLKIEQYDPGKLRCTGKVSSYKLVTTPAISHEWGDARIVITTKETYPSSFMTQIFRNVLLGQWNWNDFVMVQ
jgi:hypothetical protein